MDKKQQKEWLKELKLDRDKRVEEMSKYNNTDLWVLKNLPRNLKGMSFWGKLDRIRKNIRWAWQRAWRGYDDLAIYNYDLWFPDITMQILKDLYEVNHGAWAKPLEERTNDDDVWYEFDETQSKIKNMVMLLNMVNDLESEDSEIQQAQKEFLIQLSKYWNNLWW